MTVCAEALKAPRLSDEPIKGERARLLMLSVLIVCVVSVVALACTNLFFFCFVRGTVACVPELLCSAW